MTRSAQDLVWFALQASEKGQWPVAGGLLDQSAWFLRVVQLVEAQFARASEEADNGGSEDD